MTWNWQKPGWPNFAYDPRALEPLEAQFLRQSGEFVGAYKHIGSNDQETLKIELISEEAVKTSQIEGELLNRDSVQSSLRAQLGLGIEGPNVKPAERGISRMMLDLYRNYADPLNDKTMFEWHKMLRAGDKEIKVIGGYRTHADAMQVVSGPIHKRTVQFVAPPSARMPEEMKRFNTWFNNTAPGGKTPLPALTRAAIAHLYFVYPSIRGRQRTHRPCARRKVAGAEPRSTEPDRARLHSRTQAQGLLRRAGAQQQGPRDRRLDDVFCEYDPASTGHYDQARGLLRRQGQVLREIPRPAQRTPGQGHCPHVS
jgi:hypothetical protein